MCMCVRVCLSVYVSVNVEVHVFVYVSSYKVQRTQPLILITIIRCIRPYILLLLYLMSVFWERIFMRSVVVGKNLPFSSPNPSLYPLISTHSHYPPIKVSVYVNIHSNTFMNFWEGEEEEQQAGSGRPAHTALHLLPPTQRFSCFIKISGTYFPNLLPLCVAWCSFDIIFLVKWKLMIYNRMNVHDILFGEFILYLTGAPKMSLVGLWYSSTNPQNTKKLLIDWQCSTWVKSEALFLSYCSSIVITSVDHRNPKNPPTNLLPQSSAPETRPYSQK